MGENKAPKSDDFESKEEKVQQIQKKSDTKRGGFRRGTNWHDKNLTTMSVPKSIKKFLIPIARALDEQLNGDGKSE